jgi:hypothetical protein
MLLYGFQRWTVMKQQMKRLGMAEKHFPRAIVEYRMTNRKCNEDIIDEMQIADINTTIKKPLQGHYMYYLICDWP